MHGRGLCVREDPCVGGWVSILMYSQTIAHLLLGRKPPTRLGRSRHRLFEDMGYWLDVRVYGYSILPVAFW